MKKSQNIAGQTHFFGPKGITVADILKIFRGGKVVYQGPVLSRRN